MPNAAGQESHPTVVDPISAQDSEQRALVGRLCAT